MKHSTINVTLVSVIFSLVAGFSGMFPAHAYASGSGEPAPCPFVAEEGRTIIYFNVGLIAYKTPEKARSNLVSVSLPQGLYTVQLASFDDHTHKQGQVQPDESWLVVLHDTHGNTIASTTPISDLPDSADAMVETVATNFTLSSGVVSARAVHAAYPDSNPNSITAVCAVFDRNEEPEPEPEPVLGSITVCKMVAGEDNIPTNGAEKSGITFSVGGLDFDGNGAVASATGVIATSTFTTPLLLNTNIFGADSTNNAQCIVYNNLTLGSYFYSREEISNETGWNTPRYNDQHTLAVEDLHDFFPYSGELFTESTVDDAARNTNADGHIVLTENRPHRTLVVLNTFEEEEEHAQCSDQTDNDGDGFVDAADPGCHSDGDEENPVSYNREDNDENSKPIITLTGAATTTIQEGDSFTDPGATAFDEEDGTITNLIVVGGTVSTATPGTYTKTYNVTDSDGAAADEKTRSIIVQAHQPASGGGNESGGGGGGGASTSSESSGGGGGGGTTITLEITNEVIRLSEEGTAIATWDTNLQATSQVVYDVVPRGSTTTIPSQSAYLWRTATSTAFVTSHSVVVYGLTASTMYYFRPISARADDDAMGKELELTPTKTTMSPSGSSVSGPATTSVAITREPCQEYLKSHIKLGEANDPIQVRNMEAFLNVFEGFTVPVNGIYEQRDFDAVGVFQERYFDDILAPWGHTERTGYVYYTTRKKINEIVCQRRFPLNAAQLEEVNAFKALLEELHKQGVSAQDAGIDTGSIGKSEEQKKDDEFAAVREDEHAAKNKDTSALENILAQPTDTADESVKNTEGLTARILDAIDERSRMIGVILIALAIFIAAVGIWRARKSSQDTPPYPPIT